MPARKRVLRAAVLSVVCAACMVPVGTVPPREPVPAAPAPAVRRDELARGVHDEANRVRRAEGLRALTSDTVLVRAAMKYAAELATRRTLSHESPVIGRETLTQRIEAEGATWQRAGENLASMSGNGTNVPSQTIQLWLGSPGHSRNLLDTAYTHTGVGVAIDQYGAWYVVQIYTVPRARR